ncbi:hypothetical protein KMW28_03335 [Flammeovirga yaeyamensis]|uniref:Uncharacterized protein n=1 Tax=Flammeovirga yaeyamensis TaxID=367791 RepID=A0AAX1N5B6_9BACT|nr:hypothetical protein [Flammeovirga yaeyamensis]MBB3701322.1 hypothetical protein [Flammeovirga yaeyamensis]NMF38209.1 hypothetical protein [Flammeovirga yaeyamensis]QWG02622.1 hypothetical protein KMW28_03335 [Flammeovirga yaeyamensis]
MDNSIIEQRIQLSYRNKEIRAVRERMKKRRAKLQYLKVSSAAAVFAIFIGLTVYINTLSVESFIASTSYSYTTRNAITTEKSTLLIASEELLNQRYEYVIDLLEDEQHSDHKDWILLKANMGLGNFDKADNILESIEDDPKHLYYSRINFKFKVDYYLIKLFFSK